jgi:transcriptional repressor NF-X1
MIKVLCSCGRKSEQMPCFKANDDNASRLSMNSLANQRIKNGESVNISEIMKNLKDFKYIQLKCDEKCAVTERNRLLAEALDIKDANFSPDPGPPKYSDTLKNSARSEPSFVADIYDKLTKLVLESRQSKLNFKNLNFPPMNSEHRHVIHELAEHFGCKTHAMDREPNRSVVVKASKDKCYLPTLSLMDAMKEETDTKSKNKITLKNYSFDSGTNESNSKLTVNTSHSMIRNITADTNQSAKESNESSKQIDYFDFKGD